MNAEWHGRWRVTNNLGPAATEKVYPAADGVASQAMIAVDVAHLEMDELPAEERPV